MENGPLRPWRPWSKSHAPFWQSCPTGVGQRTQLSSKVDRAPTRCPFGLGNTSWLRIQLGTERESTKRPEKTRASGWVGFLEDGREYDQSKSAERREFQQRLQESGTPRIIPDTRDSTDLLGHRRHRETGIRKWH